MHKRQLSKQKFDKHIKDLPGLQIEQNVRIVKIDKFYTGSLEPWEQVIRHQLRREIIP